MTQLKTLITLPKSELIHRFMDITRAEVIGEDMVWEGVMSDTLPDAYDDEMTDELYGDFLSRINQGELAPEEYRSEFWEGGMPYLSVSHYSDQNGRGAPGITKSVTIQDTKLVAKGIFFPTKLGKTCYNAVRSDIEKAVPLDERIRISIAFLDWGHVHKSNDYEFKRNNLEEICPQCLDELLSETDSSGKKYMAGIWIHNALTRVPVNDRTEILVDKAMPKTRKDDAESIVGEDIAEELDSASKTALQNRALVIKSEEVGEVYKTYTFDEVYAHEVERDQMNAVEKLCSVLISTLWKNIDSFYLEAEGVADIKAAIEKSVNQFKEKLDMASTEPVSKSVEAVVVHPLDELFGKIRSAYDVGKAQTPLAALSAIQAELDVLMDRFKADFPLGANEGKEAPAAVLEDNAVLQALTRLERGVQDIGIRVQALEESKPVKGPVLPARRSLVPAQVAGLAVSANGLPEGKKLSSLSQRINQNQGLPADYVRKGSLVVESK
jgi:hypothetical protein